MTPELRHVCDIEASVGPIRDLGPTPHGRRRIIPILGGIVKGPRLQGEMMPGGADWQYVRSDGVLELEARYSIKASDGTEIAVDQPRHAPRTAGDHGAHVARRGGRPRARLFPRLPRCSRRPPARTSGSTAAFSSAPRRAYPTRCRSACSRCCRVGQGEARNHRQVAAMTMVTDGGARPRVVLGGGKALARHHAIVGSVLNLINQGDALLLAGTITWWKIVVTYCVPFASQPSAPIPRCARSDRSGSISGDPALGWRPL